MVNEIKINIRKECQDFLSESNGNPILKCLPSDGHDSRKIKLRKRKTKNKIDSIFNNVFIETPDIRQRSLYVQGINKNIFENDHDLFYVFPIDGYKFIYSPEVKDANEYDQTLETLFQHHDNDYAIGMIKSVIGYDYITEGLSDAIDKDCEILFYGIPYYYAVRASTVNSYSTLFSL